MNWWQHNHLKYHGGYLHLGDTNLNSLCLQAGTPTYAYSSDRISDNVYKLRTALGSANINYRIFYAIKANRNLHVLSHIRNTGVGADCCSPGELLLARQAGWNEQQISYTSAVMSKGDLEIIARHPDMYINCDSITQIEAIGKILPGKEIGIRVNPSQYIGCNNHLDDRQLANNTSKFGVYHSSFKQALDVACRYNMKVIGIHCHSGWGYLNSQLSSLENVLIEIEWFINQCNDLKYINIGGGLSVPIRDTDTPLDLDK